MSSETRKAGSEAIEPDSTKICLFDLEIREANVFRQPEQSTTRQKDYSVYTAVQKAHQPLLRLAYRKLNLQGIRLRS